jgi:hypothetical protein
MTECRGLFATHTKIWNQGQNAVSIRVEAARTRRNEEEFIPARWELTQARGVRVGTDPRDALPLVRDRD